MSKKKKEETWETVESKEPGSTLSKLGVFILLKLGLDFKSKAKLHR